MDRLLGRASTVVRILPEQIHLTSLLGDLASWGSEPRMSLGERARRLSWARGGNRLCAKGLEGLERKRMERGIQMAFICLCLCGIRRQARRLLPRSSQLCRRKGRNGIQMTTGRRDGIEIWTEMDVIENVIGIKIETGAVGV
jgi:hypothetical protein